MMRSPSDTTSSKALQDDYRNRAARLFLILGEAGHERRLRGVQALALLTERHSGGGCKTFGADLDNHARIGDRVVGLVRTRRSSAFVRGHDLVLTVSREGQRRNPVLA